MEVSRLLALPVVEELADEHTAATVWQGMPYGGGRAIGAGTSTEEEFEGAVVIGFEIVAVNSQKLLDLSVREVSSHHRDAHVANRPNVSR